VTKRQGFRRMTIVSQIATVYFAYYYYCFTTDATGSWLLKKKDPNWP
jgi:hypothetical protein